MGCGVAVWGTFVLTGVSVTVTVSVSVGLGVTVKVGVKEGRTKPVAVGSGVCEATFSTVPGLFPTGVQVGGI